MNDPRYISTLIDPIFLCVIQHRELALLGEEISLDKFRADIVTLFEKAKEGARRNMDISRDFERIEHPLIFFIDYMVKEGPFPFKSEWRCLARDFNELSGDEKFFEILEDVLKYSDRSATLLPFFTMLSLGFDGVRHSDPAAINNYIKTLSDKIKSDFDHRAQYFTEFQVKQRTGVKAASVWQKYRIILVCAAFAFIALIINLTSYLSLTSAYRRTLSNAVSESVVRSSGQRNVLPPVPSPRPVAAQQGASAETSPAALETSDTAAPEAAASNAVETSATPTSQPTAASSTPLVPPASSDAAISEPATSPSAALTPPAVQTPSAVQTPPATLTPGAE
jgi:type VI protein secretion system component VasF